MAKVQVSRRGCAQGVVLQDGSEVRSRVVLSNASPQATFLQLLPQVSGVEEKVSGRRAETGVIEGARTAPGRERQGPVRPRLGSQSSPLLLSRQGANREEASQGETSVRCPGPCGGEGQSQSWNPG